MPTPQPSAVPASNSDYNKIISLANQVISSKETGKTAYEIAGAALADLIPLLRVGEVVTLLDGRQFKFVDNFLETNLVYRPAAVSRFELLPLTKKEASETPKTATIHLVTTGAT